MTLPAYQPGQALAYVQQQGWTHKVLDDEIILDACPLCGKTGWKFYLNNSTGLFVDHHASCGRSGNFFQFQRELGDLPETVRAFPKQALSRPPRKRWPLSSIAAYEAALETDAGAQAYLAGRGLTMDTARAWHLGVKTETDGRKWLVIPFVTAGEVADVKFRSLPPAPKAFMRKGSGESVLYGEHLLDTSIPRAERILWICEGESDAVTLWQHGFTPVVSTTTGAGNFAPRWVDLVCNYDPAIIYVVYDSDPAGQAGAEKLLRKFDDRDIRNVVLPCKDANDFFLTHTKAEFEALLAEARPTEVENVITLPDALDALETRLFLGKSAFDGFPSQFHELNEMMAGGFWRSQLTTVSGAPGTGKTSFVLQEMWTLAKTGVPAFFICLEMPAEMILRKLIEHEFRKPKLDLMYGDVQAYRPLMEQTPFYFGERAPNLKTLEKTIRGAVKRYDAQVIGFDNIHFFARSRDHQTEEIALVTKFMKELAVELGIAFLAVAQPRKFDADERVIRGEDLKGSSSIADDSDTVLLLYRRRNRTAAKDFGKGGGFRGNHSPYALLRVEKARFSCGGETYLFFDGEFSRFRALTPEERDKLTGGGE